MIYKVILKSCICLIGIILINSITYGILSINYADNVGSWPNIVSVFFRDLFFKNNFYLFHYSIILSILSFISFLIYEYFIDQKRLDKEEILTNSIKFDLIAIGAGNLIWGIVLILIGMGLWIANIVFLIVLLIGQIIIFFLKVPYTIGWEVLFKEEFFEYPSTYIFVHENYDSIGRFIIILIFSIIYLLFLFASFSKRSRFVKTNLNSNNWEEDATYKFHNSMRLIYFLYLIYLTPTIFVWLYPIILNWLDKQPSDSLAFAQIRFPYKVLSYLFVSGLLFTIYKIIKNNRRVMMIDMREEIKIEIMKDKKTDHNSV